jgi:hypothetical protein
VFHQYKLCPWEYALGGEALVVRCQFPSVLYRTFDRPLGCGGLTISPVLCVHG